MIYTQDHAPAHVHLIGEGQAKINLLGPHPEVVYSIGIRRQDLRRLVADVAERRDRLLAEWERIHGGP